MQVNSRRWDAALFDVDGTLIDSLEVIVEGLGATYTRFLGLHVPREEILALIGRPLREQVGHFSPLPLSEDQSREMVEFAVQAFAQRKALEHEFAPAVEALRACKYAGLKTAVVTSKSQPELDLFLQEFSGAADLDAAVCASHVVHPKPDPESALLACRLLGTLPERTVMIGDSVFDVRCARSAGCFSVAAAYGSASREALEAETPDVLAESPEALLEWVGLILAQREPAHA